MKCCVLILNYNGRAHLEICVPSALHAAARVPGGCSVAVVDNRSTDDSLEWLRQNHPGVEIMVAERNDCLFSLNPLVASRPEDFAVILNNDMHFDGDFIRVMLPHFKDPDVFAVTARVMDWDGKLLTTGQRNGAMRRFWFYKSWKRDIDHSCLTLDAGGGCAVFRRSMFVELGGFDPLYRPAYWEDTDLSYRAWKQGWRIVYEPASVIYHRVGATLDVTEGGRPSVTRLICRNEILFSLRNVGGWGFAAGFLLLLPIRMLRNAWAGHHSMWQGVFQALPKIPSALLRRFFDVRIPGCNQHDFLEAIRRSSR